MAEFILCKQGVAGSSPVVSTAKVLVKAHLGPDGTSTDDALSPHFVRIHGIVF